MNQILNSRVFPHLQEKPTPSIEEVARHLAELEKEVKHLREQNRQLREHIRKKQ